MRSSKVIAALALTLTLATAARVRADGCGAPGSTDPCLSEYYARYCADDCYRDEESHPFRILAYAINPIGVALEWAIFRPIHWAVSRPATAPIFGHACEYDY